MSNKHSDSSLSPRHWVAAAGRKSAPFAAAFFATLLSLPTVAVTIPNVPLQSGSAYPPPNIMFILDDSGSMSFTYMPDNVPDVNPVRIENLAYPRNTLSYNPATDYLPWIKANSDNTFSRLTGGKTYGAAYSSFNDAGPGFDTIDLGDSSDCETENQNGTNLSVCGGVQTFYVPKPAATNMAITQSYYRYEITAGGADMIRAEYGAPDSYSTNFPGFPKTGQAQNSGTFATPQPLNVPTGTYQIVISTSGGSESGNGVDLYVREGSAPTTGTYDCRKNGSNNNETCTITNPNPGLWYATLYRGGNYSGVTFNAVFKTNNRCTFSNTGSNDWINCASALPASRNFAQEKINYAIWYSYFRTRMKLAKAGASEAFSQVSSNVRVGFDTIWNRDTGETDTTVGATALPTYKIPVATDNGLFRDVASPASSNRTDWYTRLFGARGNSSTPLKGALQRSGRYYGNTLTTGPWGPETGSSQISCRQSFAILTTDGYWNSDSNFVSVGDADSNTSTAESVNPTITNTQGQTYKYAPANPYRDNPSESSRSDTLADVAMNYWKQDLVTTLENNVPASAADTAYWQHMVTFGISIGLQGTLDPKSDLSSLTDGSKRWPNPLDAEDNERIDDLWHAAVNGHGSFVTATNPTEFAQALSDSLSLIAARRGSASNVATNSTSFQADTRVFQARYWSGRWTGELAAYAATSAGVAAEPAWQASQGIPAAGSRNIKTFNGTTGVDFPTAAQVTALDKSARPLSPVSGADNAAYIRGVTTQEERVGGTLRTREISIREGGADVVKPTVLGDIVNSTPIYVPELQTLFVGANDGMLHGINAVTGAERFAYVPASVNLSSLAALSDPDYVHDYLVDGPIAVSTTAQTPGYNYLVGALGRGGKGVYGLDVSTPTAFTNANVLWERNTGSNMGYVLGEPLIVTLNNGVKAVIVSNGINSSSGNAVLFILNIATGAIIKEIDTGASGGNGLSAPRGWDNDSNGTVDYVYAGDLKGNLWKFDLTAITPGVTATTGWKVALSGAPLFVAKDASNNRQPITAGLALARDPNTSRRWVFIGTGQFLSLADLTTTSVQSMYGVIDDDVVVTGRTSANDGDLQKREIVVAGTILVDTDGDGDLDGKYNPTNTSNGSDTATRSVRGFEANAPLPAAKMGWYIDLLSPPTAEGERIVSNPRIFGTALITASLIPPTENTCDAGGRGFINALDAFSGTSLDIAFFNANGTSSGGVQNFADDVLTSGGSNVPVGSIDLGLGMPTLPTLIDKLLVAGGSTGSIGSVTVNPPNSGARRVSWREILKD